MHLMQEILQMIEIFQVNIYSCICAVSDQCSLDAIRAKIASIWLQEVANEICYLKPWHTFQMKNMAKVILLIL